MMEFHDLERWLPQRPPILMLDRVVSVEPGVSGTGLRHFDPGDACFEGHFPERPLLPGVLMIEAFAQTLMVVMLSRHVRDPTAAPPEPPMGYLARVNEMSFHRTIEPGQDIAFAVRVEKELGRFTVAACRATDAAELCGKGSLAVAIDSREIEAPNREARGR